MDSRDVNREIRKVLAEAAKERRPALELL